MRSRWPLKIILPIVLFFYGSVGYADEFYKWVDENGVTHYGEALPNEDIDHVAFNFPDQYVTSNPEEDYYSIQNQLQRMLDRRKQSEKKRSASEQNASSQPPPIYVEEPRYYSGAVHHPIYFPDIKHKRKRECRGSRDCFLPARFYHNPKRRDLKNARTPINRAHKSSKRGITSGIAVKIR